MADEVDAAAELGKKDGLRRRKHESDTPVDNASPEANTEETKTMAKNDIELESGTYWLTRIVLIRYIGFIYCEH